MTDATQTPEATPETEPTPETLDGAPQIAAIRESMEADGDTPPAADKTPEGEADPAPDGELSDSEKALIEEAQSAAKEAGVEVDKPETPPAPPTDIAKAPASWKQDAAKGWDELPEAQRTEIHRREAESTAAIREKGERLNQMEPIVKRVVEASQPHEKVIEAVGLEKSIDGAMALWGRAGAWLEHGSKEEQIQAMKVLQQHYGIDLQALAVGLGAPPPEGYKKPGDSTDPTPGSAHEQERMRQKAREEAQQEAQQQQQQALSAKYQAAGNAFEATNPKHYELVKGQMLTLAQADFAKGQQPDMERYYRTALLTNPATQVEEARRIAAENAKGKGNKGGSLKPGGGGGAAGDKKIEELEGVNQIAAIRRQLNA